jgi:hypothetical protein
MPIGRAWDYWIRHVEKAALMPVRPKTKRTAGVAKRKAVKKHNANKRR